MMKKKRNFLPLNNFAGMPNKKNRHVKLGGQSVRPTDALAPFFTVNAQLFCGFHSPRESRRFFRHRRNTFIKIGQVPVVLKKFRIERVCHEGEKQGK